MKQLFTYLFTSVLLMLISISLYSQSNDLNTSEEDTSILNKTVKDVNLDEPLFEVKNLQGKTIFAVYTNGVKITLPDDGTKGTGGGFTVGRLGTGKSTTTDLFSVFPGDVRVTLPEDATKGTGGGFTVGRLGTGKSTTSDLFSVLPGDVRVILPDDSQPLKGTGGGFTVGRLGTGKSTTDVDYLSVTPDKTQITYTADGAPNNNVGFTVNELSSLTTEELFRLSNINATFLGYNSGKSITTGLYNVLLGYESGSSTTTGEKNTFVGFNTGKSNVAGQSNVFVGENSGFSNLNGKWNTFLGSYTGYANTDSSYSTFVGFEAGKNSTNGFNTCVGYASGSNGVLGTNRAFYGYGAGNFNSGNNNTFLGAQAGSNSGIGANNVYIGSGAGQTAVGSGNVLIGYNAGLNFQGSNSLFIQNSSDTVALIHGEFDNKILEFNARVGVGMSPSDSSTNILEVGGEASKTIAGNWLANSDRRIKTEITDINNASNIIMSLRPVKFKYTEEWKKRNPSIKDQFYYNYIAQEYQKVFPESVKGSGQFLENDKNEILQIDTYNAQIVSIKAIQELINVNTKQQTEIENLKAIVNQLSTEKLALIDNQQSVEAKIDGMKDQIDQLKAMIIQTGK